MSSLANTHIAFIGGGTMAEAIMRGMIAEKLAAPEQITASDPLIERQGYLSETLGIHVTGSNQEAADGADIVVLAVKPQVLGHVLDDLEGQLPADILLMSIVAGATIERIREALGVRAMVRIMPNTPGQVGEGISVWTATPETSDEQRQQAADILGALGQEIAVHDEDYLDMATALSGSGPAYVFLFIEALTDAGVQMGFSRTVAEALALQTVRGAAIYVQKTGVHPTILRNGVTSPGGTTAAALFEFEAGGLRATVARAVLAAYRRAQELGEE